jgi:hypothetical protein
MSLVNEALENFTLQLSSPMTDGKKASYEKYTPGY